MLDIIIIIPCYNEEKSINKVVQDIQRFINSNNNLDYSFDYVVINDCSKDNSLEICNNNGINYINLPVNLGIGGCVQTGYQYANENSYDIAIQHDGDGQHDPQYFYDILAPIKSGCADIVIGSRFITSHGFQSTKLRRFGIAFLSSIVRLCTNKKIYDVTSGYRAVKKDYIKLFASQYAQDYPEPESIIVALRNGAKINEVPVIMNERKEGKSSINALRSIYYMIKVSLSLIIKSTVLSKRINI